MYHIQMVVSVEHQKEEEAFIFYIYIPARWNSVLCWLEWWVQLWYSVLCSMDQWELGGAGAWTPNFLVN